MAGFALGWLGVLVLVLLSSGTRSVRREETGVLLLALALRVAAIQAGTPARGAYSPGWVMAAAAGDMAVVILVLGLLRRRALPARLALLHAANPLVLYGLGWSGGTFVALLLPLLGGLDLYERGRRLPASIALSLAGAAIPLSPLRQAWIGAPAGGSLQEIIGLADIASWVAPAVAIAGLGLTLSLALALRGDPARAILLGLGGCVAFAPSGCLALLPAAYPFVSLRPSLPWILLGFTAPLALVGGGNPEPGGNLVTHGPNALRFGACIPFLAVGVWEARHLVRGIARRAPWRRILPRQTDSRREKAGRSPAPTPLSWPPPRTYSVVIPTLDEAASLPAMLAAVAALRPSPEEILVADGGSTDGSAEIARRRGARIVTSPRGRGLQIRAAAEEARGDVILVLHADAVPAPDVPARMLCALRWIRTAAGGAVGQRYDARGATYRFIEILNDGRAAYAGSSFGDQGQFFRRDALAEVGGFPEMALMEDVELSLRLAEAGGAVFLGGGLVVSARGWRETSALRRALLVAGLVFRYRARRLRGHPTTDDLYRLYYGTRRTDPPLRRDPKVR